MKPRHFLALPLLFAAAPALATGGFDCATTDGSDIRMIGTVGHVVGAPLVGVTLIVGGQSQSTTDTEPAIVIARSWLDSERIWVDLADPQLERFEAQLRVAVGEEWTATGTLLRDGVTHPVRCELE